MHTDAIEVLRHRLGGLAVVTILVAMVTPMPGVFGADKVDVMARDIGVHVHNNTVSGTPRLVFTQAHVEIELPIDGQEADIVFSFKNVSGSTVQIREIKTECDCTRGSATLSVLEAGQAGDVVLNFRAKSRNGTEVIRAEVITDGNESYPISVSVKLHSYIEVAPPTLLWKKGELRVPREFVVSFTGLGKLRFTKVATVMDSKLEMISGEDPMSIRVLVDPPPGDARFQSVVLVTATMEETGETKLYGLHVRGD